MGKISVSNKMLIENMRKMRYDNFFMNFHLNGRVNFIAC